MLVKGSVVALGADAVVADDFFADDFFDDDFLDVVFFDVVFFDVVFFDVVFFAVVCGPWAARDPAALRGLDLPEAGVVDDTVPAFLRDAALRAVGVRFIAAS